MLKCHCNGNETSKDFDLFRCELHYVIVGFPCAYEYNQ